MDGFTNLTIPYLNKGKDVANGFPITKKSARLCVLADFFVFSQWCCLFARQLRVVN